MPLTHPRITDHVEELIALSADLYWEQDELFRFTFVTSNYLALNGMAQPEVLGKARWDLPALNLTPADWAVHRGTLERREPFRDLQIEKPGQGAGSRWISVSGAPRFAANGTFTGYRGLTRDITALKQAETAARDDRALLDLVINSVPAVIARLDRGLRVLYANRAFAQSLNCAAESLAGRLLPAVIGAKHFATVEPHLQRALGGETASYVCSHGGDPARREYEFRVVPDRSPDGGVRGVFMLGNDISEAARARDALAAKAAELEALHAAVQRREAEKALLLDNLGVSVSRADREERLTYVNRLFAENQGLPAAAVVGRRVIEIASPDIYAWYKPLYDRALAGEAGEHARWVERPGRGRLYILTRVLPDLSGGTVTGVYTLGVDITAMQVAQEALLEKEHEFRHLLDSIPAVVGRVDRDERFTYSNDLYAASCGQTPEQIVGRTVQQVLGDQVYARIAGHIARAHREEVATYERHMVDASGKSSSYRFSLVPDRDALGQFTGTYIFGADLTELYRARDLLAAKQSELNHVLESVPFGISRVDSATTFTYVNAEFSKFIGPPPEQITGRTFREVLGEPLAGAVLPVFERARAGEVVTNEREYTSRSGETRWVQMIVRADPDPSARGVFTVAVDVTDRHAQEARTAGLLEQLKAANEELESFAYTVSHDLRAPLRAISGFASILVQEAGTALGAQTHHYLDRITSNAGKMSELIEGLLRFSQLARQELLRVRVSPESLVAEIVADHEHDLSARDIRLKVGALPECSGDPVLLRQVFANLIGNAFKYTAGRTPAEIEIGSMPTPEGTAYFVQDNGAGFDAAYAHKLFGVFQRLHSDKEFAGTGIGLATARRIVGRHGGRIWAESEVGRGARFCFTLGAG